jgi:hypothetical protein
LTAYIIPFERLGRHDVETVGGKNASIGEMIANLASLGVRVPGGFATTAQAYRDFLAQEGLGERIAAELQGLDVDEIDRLTASGARIRSWILDTPFHPRLQAEIEAAWDAMAAGRDIAVAVRSSATAEDLPTASFAGQQETFLNVQGQANVLRAMHEVYASLFNDRAIAYRVHQGFDHNQVAISVGVQHMVRSDLGASGVLFTLDTESGFREAVFITASWGLGEMVVQGAVNPDEFYVYKPALRSGHYPIIRRSLGAKASKMIYAAEPSSERRVATVDVAAADRQRFCIRRGRDRAGSPRTGHRAALRLSNGHRVGQGRAGRRHLYPAGPPRDRAEPHRAQHPALQPEGPLPCADQRPRDRPAHRRGAGTHHPRRQGDEPGSARGRAGRRHDRPGLGAGDEARGGDRHQPRRAHLPRGHHRA